MPNYIVLGNYTEQGVRDVKGAPGRMEKAGQHVESLGGKIKDIYFTFGQYDFVGIFEFPNDDSMMSFSMQVAREGNIRFTTLKATPKDDAVRIINGLS
ncbi:MAG: GYD domain-containing protein [Chloroflexi bacterium]|nr:GYD domain-containing protein [Chloroflexota bacterium]